MATNTRRMSTPPNERTALLAPPGDPRGVVPATHPVPAPGLAILTVPDAGAKSRGISYSLPSPRRAPPPPASRSEPARLPRSGSPALTPAPPSRQDSLKQSKGVKEFYAAQDRLLRAYRRIDEGKHPQLSEEEEDEAGTALRVRLAVNTSFAANILLFAMKCYASYASGSLSVLGSTIESFLDLLSSFLLWAIERVKSSKNDNRRYPVGKARIEPVGILVFAAVMGVSSIQLILYCITRLISGKNEALDLDKYGVAILLFTIVSKLVLWIWCRSLRHSPSCQAYSVDHRNDVISNSIGTVCAWAGEHYLWWLDPAGAILFSLFIVYDYMNMSSDLVKDLLGETADPFVLNCITYAAGTHDEAISHVDTVRAFKYSSDTYWVEVDVVMDRLTLLYEAHDAGESLQKKLETWPFVHRVPPLRPILYPPLTRPKAIVHVDYEFDHKPEH